MATSATVRSAYIIPYSNKKPMGAEVRKMLVADSQTFVVGDFVILSSGKVAIANTGTTASTNYTLDVFGVCQDAVTNSGTSSTTYANIQVITPETRLIGNYCGTTTTAPTGIAISAALVGTQVCLRRLAGKWVLGALADATQTTNAICWVDNIAPQDNDGNPAGGSVINGGRLIFKFDHSVL